MGLTKEEFEAKRAERRKARGDDEAREAQAAKDREAILEIESERDCELDVSLSVQHFVPGHPVILGVRPPTEAEYKRFFQKFNRANASPDARSAAFEELAQTCWAYPSGQTEEGRASRKALLAANPAILAQVGAIANKLAEARQEDEGKG